jgi:urease accessory protein
MTESWLLLQLADGTFPSGAFAHSSGLEAATVLGGLTGVEGFLDAALEQVASASLPFVRAAAIAPARLAALDDACDATLPLALPNQASRAQGRALAGAASRVWEVTQSIADHAAAHPAHHAPVLGAIFGALGIAADDAAAVYLHGTIRGILSAAVRLGLVGPLEAQRLIAERAPLLGALLASSRDLAPDDAAQTAPLVEIFAALHDRLDGRMFQS